MYIAATPREYAHPGPPRNANALKMEAPVMKYMASTPNRRSAATYPATLRLALRPAKSPIRSVVAR